MAIHSKASAIENLLVYRKTREASTANMLLFQQPYLVLELAEQMLLGWFMLRQQNLGSLLTYSSPETPDKWIYPADFLHQKFPNQKKRACPGEPSCMQPQRNGLHATWRYCCFGKHKFPLSIKS